MKPYRLINTCELEQIRQRFSQALSEWNKEFSMTPLTMNIDLPPKDYFVNQEFYVHEHGIPIAMIGADYLSLINQVLFEKNLPCFAPTSQELLLILLNQLFKLKHCVINKKVESYPHWIYPGSTCLLLTLNSNQTQLHILLNPDWVYQSLTSNSTQKNSLFSLDEVLQEQRITLNLELNPVSLPINQLINLQVGHVISTDHLLSAPLRLVQENKSIAQAILGQSEHHKSLVIEEFQ